MNSLVICVSCKRKGYRSRLPYLQNDQDPANTVIASDNATVQHAIRRGHKLGVKVHIQSCVNCYAKDGCDIPIPPKAKTSLFDAIKFDLETPTVFERAIEQCEELVDIFPDADGLSVELEVHNVLYAHAAQAYDAWAAANGRPSYRELRDRPPNPRVDLNEEVRAYTTARACELYTEIEKAVRARGFRGDLSAICGSSARTGAYTTECDFGLFAEKTPHWIAITYEYARCLHRLAAADFCMAWPKSFGLTTHYLGRGVMTWGMAREDWMPVSFEEHWRRDFEDALTHGVDGLWMFEADAHTDGDHACVEGLRQKGFADGREARLKLLALADQMGVPQSLA
ncbi:MAG: hypothetical protein HQ582_14715 [Planctomycetes bacterium]|nr:hypothetical protein [Planctomycetota bacterium]